MEVDIFAAGYFGLSQIAVGNVVLHFVEVGVMAVLLEMEGYLEGLLLSKRFILTQHNVLCFTARIATKWSTCLQNGKCQVHFSQVKSFSNGIWADVNTHYYKSLLQEICLLTI